MIKVKIMLSLSVDEDEYPVPSDGKVGDELEDYLKDVIHEIDGIKIRTIKTLEET
jgi:hypothetical protein